MRIGHQSTRRAAEANSTRGPPFETLILSCLGVVTGLVVLGPGLGSGALLNLDLVVVRQQPVPSGVWGLGPDLPRRVPAFLPLSWASTVVGTAAGKAVIVAAIAVAFIGAARLVRSAPFIARIGAGFLYTLSPFTLTRLAAGQLTLLAAMAVLPWALPRLLRPHDDLTATVIWSAALGCCGSAGGEFAVPIVLVGLAAARGRRARAVIGALALGQLPWVVPAIVVTTSGASPRLAPASAFATNTSGPAGFLRLLAGHGFWQLGNQVGGPGGVGVALAGVGLGALGLLGATRIPGGWWRPGAALAGLGVVLAVASAVPGVRDLYAHFADTTIGAPLRESQRFLALYVVWLAAAAPLGAVRLAGARPGAAAGAVTAVPAALALILAGPGFWGIGGRLDPVHFPRDWELARAAIQARPGTVLALPWNEYLDLGFAGGRRCLNPAPDYFGGDVLVSSDPELGPVAREGLDPRAPAALRIVGLVRRGRPASRALARLGVRWVFLMHEVDWHAYRRLATDPGLVRVTGGSSGELFRVRAWRGPVSTAAGRTPRLRSLVAPFALVGASPSAVVDRPAAAGWLRGTAAAGRTPDGLLKLPAGSGPVWYWPTVVVLSGDVVTAGVVALVLARRRRRGRPLRRVGGPGEEPLEA